MTWVVMFLGLFVLVTWVLPVCTDWYFSRKMTSWRRVRRLQAQNDLMSSLLEAADETNAEIWGWLKKANARRKRIESALRRQREFGDSMHRRNLSLLEDVRQLIKHVRSIEEENAHLENRNRHLAAELANEILTAQDRETVTKGLTRKL
jgi:hypothetical protein